MKHVDYQYVSLVRVRKKIVDLGPKANERINGRKVGRYGVTPLDVDGHAVGTTKNVTAMGMPWSSNDVLYGQVDGSILGATGGLNSFVVDPTSMIDQFYYHDSIINGVESVIQGTNQ
jgi:hypothetical protein